MASLLTTQRHIHFIGIGGIGMSGGNGEEDTKVGLAALKALSDNYKNKPYYYLKNKENCW